MKRRHSLPAEVYALVDRTPAAVLLDGGRPGNRTESSQFERNEAPWTRLFTTPLRVCAAWQPAEMAALFDEIERAVQAGLWAAGFFSYECGQHFEPKAKMREGASNAPLAWFGIYDRSYGFNHETGEFVGGEPPQLAAIRASTASHQTTVEVKAEFALSESEYARRIAAIHEWIRAGDVYQLNFTAPWRVQIDGPAAALYAQLRARQPAQYGAFLHWQPGRRILSFSPELFFRVENEGSVRRITTRPMKGTAPRGRTTRDDRGQAEWLRNDPKNRSENVMIVDLLRNDLGRVSRFGSVRAEELFTVERYPTLWQMTSTITAELRPEASSETSYEEIFRALFPCGSITGAPKVRAMQLIAEVEDQPRGVYTGAIGFFSPERAVFNVAIRTLELDGNRGTMGTGSGIVIDSDPAEEYRECLLKAKFLTQSADRSPAEFSLIETMLWNGAYPMLELHLDRLMDSADYFDFACEREEVRKALDAHAHAFEDNAARKVRLLLDREGQLSITSEVLLSPVDNSRIGRVRIARERTNPSDPMLFHKTTHRPLYAAAFQQAACDGFDDALFFNLRGELTEAAISSVFIEKEGRLLTPPVECGLLAGVYRRHLLETRTDIEERILYEDDLRNADTIYLANAVRGLRRVRVDWENLS
jgi:para-aminobenzoate synthetase/4-amino-4-deoxychorismate lyase